MSEFDPKRILNSLPLKPGVYQMLGQDDEVLYVGKAKKLKNRVSSYFRASGLNTKTMALVSHIRDIQVTVTANETEALVLEQNLIRSIARRITSCCGTISRIHSSILIPESITRSPVSPGQSEGQW